MEGILNGKEALDEIEVITANKGKGEVNKGNPEL